MIEALRRFLGGGRPDAVERLRENLGHFRDLVQKNDRVLTLIAEAGEKLGGEYLFDRQYLRTVAKELRENVHGVISDLAAITGDRYPELVQALAAIDTRVAAAMELRMVVPEAPFVLPLSQVGLAQEEIAGEKMARLGEISSRLGLPVPPGFVVTTWACQEFLEDAGVADDVQTLSESGTGPSRELEAMLKGTSINNAWGGQTITSSIATQCSDRKRCEMLPLAICSKRYPLVNWVS